MAGARPSSFKKGGGFLNGVVATIMDYEFSDEFNGKAFEPGRDPVSKKERFHSLYAKLVVRADGATEDTTTTFFVGGFDDFTVSPDGHTLLTGDLGRNTGWGQFIVSMCDNGFPDTRFPEDVADWSAIIGTRCKFGTKKNEKMKAENKQRTGKNGKKYDYEDIVVTEVIELPAEGTKAPGKTTASSKAEAFDVAEQGELTIQKILKGKGVKSIRRLGTMVLSELADNTHRDEIYGWLADKANLDAMAKDDIIVYDKANGTVALPSEVPVTA